MDNVRGIMIKMKDSDFIHPIIKTELLEDLENIRTHVLQNEMIEVHAGYYALKSNIENKVNNTEFQQKLLTVVNRNIESTSHTVPEFETITILILIISISSIIVVSRRSSFNIINFK